MIIAIDHGNSAIKTPHFSFVAGVSEHTVKPPMTDEVLEYDGKFWTLTGNRLSYMRIKPRTAGILFSHCLPLPENWKAKANCLSLNRFIWLLACLRNITVR